MRHRSVLPTGCPPVLLALALGACAPSGQDHPLALQTLDTSDPETVFLALSETPTAVMEALFQGRVIRDAAGCLRLDAPAPDGATVVWPHGFTLQETGDELRVLDTGGGIVGRIGEMFRFGGGFVQALHEGIPLTDADRALAISRCPGAYWIVGDIL